MGILSYKSGGNGYLRWFVVFKVCFIDLSDLMTSLNGLNVFGFSSYSTVYSLYQGSLSKDWTMENIQREKIPESFQKQILNFLGTIYVAFMY